MDVTEAFDMKVLVLLPEVILIQSLMKANLVFPQKELMFCIEPFIHMYAHWVTPSE